MNSGDILRLLQIRHSEDLFIPECKNGQTWMTSHKRLDAWAMPRSWANLKYIGYEIKVSRSDFLKDDKWHEYLKMCNELYFVMPKGICSVDELPAEAGLLEVASTGSRLLTRKRAAYREIKFPEDLFIYILMCRAEIKKERYFDKSNVEYWQGWLQDKTEKSRLGLAVSKKLKKNYEEFANKVEQENKELKAQMSNYEEFKRLLAEIGVKDKDSYWRIRDRIMSLREKICVEQIDETLAKAKDILTRMQNDVKMIKQEFLA